MKYLEFNFKTIPYTEIVTDVLSAVLGEVGFDSFIENEKGITAYILKELFNEKSLKEALKEFPLDNVEIQYTWIEVEDKDWNEEWEKNFFQPIIIDNRCVIHSTFHRDIPTMEYDILINPQMAFGTGHHETTSLIISELLDSDLENRSVLDMGCGTSILAILARMRGAKPIMAIDIDTWCIDNSKENIALNQITDIEVELGDASILETKGPFDVVIANINRNILLEDMKFYVERMIPGATLYMSGFYVEDIPLLKEEAAKYKLQFKGYKEKNNWAAIRFTLDK